MRSLVNSIPIILLTAFVWVGVLNLIPSLSPILSAPGWALLAIASVFFALPGVLANVSIRNGTVPCPCCGEPFAPRTGFYIAEECQNCGFNCRTQTRRGDF